MISLTNCPVALVPDPPAVTVMAPVVRMVPANVSFDPAAVLVTEEKLGTAPVDGAEVAQRRLG